MSTALAQAHGELRSAWIVSGPADLALFLATPLVCCALLLLVLVGPLSGVASLDVFIFVMAFSSVGHHLPGFLRAYGDRELFERFRMRFLLAPPLGFVAFYLAASFELQALALLLMLWSIWHVSMQHYGFTRIYDAKALVRDRLTARLDFWLALLSFTGVVLASPGYSHNLLATAHASRVLPVFTDSGLAWLGVARWIVWSAALAVFALHAGRTLFRLRRKLPTSVQKLVLIASTTGFLWLVWVELGDIYLGLATWEIFHDVQYFAITWTYNKRLVAKGFGSTGLMRFLFAGRAVRCALYVAAIALYGGAAYLGETRSSGAWRPVVLSLALTSTFLHYYYDGFIWKVREARTQAGLDLEAAGGRQPAAPRTSWMPGTRHLVGLALPVFLLCGIELTSVPALEGESGAALARELLVRTAIRDAVPTAGAAHLNLALVREAHGDLAGAREAYTAALELDASNAEALASGALLDLRLKPDLATAREQAAVALARAIELEPRVGRHHLNLAILELDRAGPLAALVHFREARRLAPELVASSPDACYLDGLAALADGDLEGAVERLEFVERQPLQARRDVSLALISAYEAQGRFEASLLSLEALLERSELSADSALWYTLQKRRAYQLLALGRPASAVPVLRELVALASDDSEPLLWLAEVEATNRDPELRNGAEALACAERAVTLSESKDPAALDIRAAAKAELGRFDEALEDVERALELMRAAGRSGDAGALEARRALYLTQKPYHAP